MIRSEPSAAGYPSIIRDPDPDLRRWSPRATSPSTTYEAPSPQQSSVGRGITVTNIPNSAYCTGKLFSSGGGNRKERAKNRRQHRCRKPSPTSSSLNTLDLSRLGRGFKRRAGAVIPQGMMR